jgi:enoyl-[acyl-carrier protein] reductase II
MAVYFGGRLEEGIALAGEVSGRIRSVEPVADVLADTIDGFRATAAAMSRYA